MPSTFTVIVRKPDSNTIVRECGHAHVTGEAAEKCLKKLRKLMHHPDPEKNPWHDARIEEELTGDSIPASAYEEDVEHTCMRHGPKVSYGNMNVLVRLLRHFHRDECFESNLDLIINQVESLAHMAYLQGKIDGALDASYVDLEDEDDEEEDTPTIPGPQGVN